MGTMHTQETYQKQPNQQAQQQQPVQQQQQQQPVQAPQQQAASSFNQQQPSYNEVKQVKKQSVVQNNNIEPQMQAAQPVNPQGGGVPDVHGTKTYEEAKLLNVPNKEAYLADDEFEKLFGMNKEAFYKLRPWKQKNIKRAKGLF